MIDPAPYNRARQGMVAALVRMKTEAEQYAKRSNANAEVVKIRQEQLKALAAALDGMDDAVEGLLHDSLEAERRAYGNGRRSMQPKPEVRQHYDRADKETIRSRSLEQARIKWGDIF